MKNLVRILILLCFTVLSCSHQTQVEMKVKILIYPSGGGEIGYELSIDDSQYIVDTKELGIENESIVLKKTINSESRNLSFEQREIIQGYISKLEEFNIKYENAELALDTWVFSIELNGGSPIIVNSFILSKSSAPSELKSFIKYLIDLSPSKIELKGFS